MNVVGDITGDDWPGSSCARLLRLALAAYFGLRSSNEVFTDHKSLVKTHRPIGALAGPGVIARSLCSPPTFRRLGLAWVGQNWKDTFWMNRFLGFPRFCQIYHVALCNMQAKFYLA